MTRSLISVIIPTRNHEKTARVTIDQIVGLGDSRLELVVQDNGDDDNLGGHIRTAYPGNERIIYHHTPGQISFVDNFEEALGLATGEFICFIGDDDAINPALITCAEWMKRNDVEAVQYAQAAVYVWPDVSIKSKIGGERRGVLSIERVTGRTCVCNVQREFARLLANGGQEYLRFHLPKLYHGVVRMEALERIRRERTRIFNGLSPDIYSVGLMSLYIRRVVYIDYPFTISGIAAGSGSAKSGTNSHIGKYEDMPHLAGHDDYRWNCLVPRYYSVETVWADSLLAAMADSGRYDKVRQFHPHALAAHCLVKHPDFAKETLDCMRMNARNGSAALWEVFRARLYQIIPLLMRRVFNAARYLLLRGQRIEEQEVENIADAAQIVTQKLRHNVDDILLDAERKLAQGL